MKTYATGNEIDQEWQRQALLYVKNLDMQSSSREEAFMHIEAETECLEDVLAWVHI